jgi:hypothetical protein
MTGLLFFGVSLAILKAGSLDPSHYYAVPVDDGTAQEFDPGSKLAAGADRFCPDGQITEPADRRVCPALRAKIF